MTNNFELYSTTQNFEGNQYLKRDCFSQITQYLQSTKHEHRICAIYGLRRTGKTTLLQQAIESLSDEQKQKTVYINCINGKTTFDDILIYMKDKLNNGYKYFFVDEITYTDDFQRAATVLSDIFVNFNNAKVVVTGTDSLGLYLSSLEEMYDRIQFVNTTYTTFGEYSRLTGIETINEYIQKGSVLQTDSFESYDSTKSFVSTAIVGNIIRSVEKSKGIRRYPGTLTERYKTSQLKNEIERIVNRYSQTRTYQAITQQFKSAPLGDAKDVIRKHYDNGIEITNNLKYQEVNAKIASLLGCEILSNIEDDDINTIYKYLQKIGVFMNIPVYKSYETQTPDKTLEMICHPGMFHANIRYVLDKLIEDSSWIDATKAEKQLFLNKAYESAMGKIMENVVIADMYYLLCDGKEVYQFDATGNNSGRYYVSKLNCIINDRSCEADVLVFDKETKDTYLFEVKHSSQNVSQQSKHLENPEFLQYVEEEFGPIKQRVVLYNGVTDITSEIPRIDTSKFLIQLYKNKKEPNFSLSETIQQVLDNELEKPYQQE